MKAHQKHAKLVRPPKGTFGAMEWSILGTPCGVIKQLAYALTKELADDYRMAYIDADHKSADDEIETGRDIQTALGNGAWLEFTDKITFSRLDYNTAFNQFDYREQFRSADVVLVNGNHFPAARQIAVIDPRKPLAKKLAKLTQVELILMTEGVGEMPDYLKEALGPELPPVLAINQIDQISAFLRSRIANLQPKVKGLVLAGGKSQRMQQDKGLLSYHGVPQRKYMYDLLLQAGVEEVFYSCRAEQATELGVERSLADKFLGLGPFGGILTAFQSDPNAAWLVVACDQPFLTRTTIEQLLQWRNPSKIATAFHNPATDFPEPLITLWEPRAYARLLHYLSLGYSCPRKVLINSEIELLQHAKPEEMANINKPDEFAAAVKRLKEMQS
ncbi:MAG: NTP transferase domain-containing protein [Bacteroidia bacterium]